jgi:hypothetical protein
MYFCQIKQNHTIAITVLTPARPVIRIITLTKHITI